MKKLLGFLMTCILIISLLIGLSSCTTEELVVLNISCAASVTDALTEINNMYMQEKENITLVANFSASGTLQKQIEQGAPADVFISAAAKQMDALQTGGFLIDSTRQNLLNNKVVLVVPSNSTLNISDFKNLLNDSVKQIAIGDPEFVPAGTYGKQALEVLSIYEQVKAKLMLGTDVRAVLGYVEAGNVDAGIVYSTDAAITSGVKIAADAPNEVNSQIVYPVAIIKGCKNVAAAEAYISFLFSNEAKAIFGKYGFSAANK